MPLTLRPLAPTFGAEVRGVDLRHPDPAKIGEIYEAFLEHGVLVIPGQALTIEQQLAFAATFGELWRVPRRNDAPRRIADTAIDDVSNLDARGELAPPDSERVMFQLGNQLWHSDLSFQPVPAQASMLHALEIAPEGGETEFADLRGAYDALPPARRDALEGLIAQHSLGQSRIRGGYSGMSPEEIDRRFPPALQPVVRIHPETGRRNLYLGAHASRIVGMDEKAGAALLEELLDFATADAFVYRHRWAVHDLVIWDNRRALHRGRPYPGDARRVMHRATIQGDGPTVVDGRIVVPEIRQRGPAARPGCATA